MEVHAHTHTPRKKWTHYLWEFLMLFLAVFCGFLAENIREHKVEKEREKQYIKSLVEDLKADQVALSAHIANVTDGIRMMDTLIYNLDHPEEIASHTGEIYFLARLAPRLFPLSISNRTFEQLKNSGSFRLIHSINISNKIMAYYEKLPLVRLLESINETEFTEYKKAAAKIFDPGIFVSMEGANNGIVRRNDNPPLKHMETDRLEELSIFSVYMHGTKKGVLGAADEMKRIGAALINDLQKEYHLN